MGLLAIVFGGFAQITYAGFLLIGLGGLWIIAGVKVPHRLDVPRSQATVSDATRPVRAASPTELASGAPVCPTCGQILAWVGRFDCWYCDRCAQYRWGANMEFEGSEDQLPARSR